MKWILAITMMLAPLISGAAGDLPFPFENIRLLATAELWSSPSVPFLVLCQNGVTDRGERVTIVRFATTGGLALGQKVVRGGTDVEADLLMRGRRVTFRRHEAKSGPLAVLQVDAEGPVSLELKPRAANTP